MPPLDLSLYLVLDPDLCGGPQGMVQTARLAAENGVSMVQLRAPHWKKRLWLDTARELKAVLDPLRVPLIINDHLDVALAVDAAGIHVGQGDLPAQLVRRLIGPHKLLGLSVSNAAELAQAPLDMVDYLGIGPVYPTATKLDAAPATGLTVFAELVRASAVPVVAIGGIHQARCAELLFGGAEGVAVVSAICGQSDPAQATRSLREAINHCLSPRSCNPRHIPNE